MGVYGPARRVTLGLPVEQMLPAKDKEDLCKEEGCAAADDASSAGRRRAARPGPGGAAEAGEHPGWPGAQQGEAGTPHPGGRREVQGCVNFWARAASPAPGRKRSFPAMMPQHK